MLRLISLVSMALSALSALLAFSVTPAQALTFTFTCQVVTSLTPDSCVEGGSGPGDAGPFGTLTLTDSANDPNRVDISWTMTPQWGTNIERVLLNWAGPPAFPLTNPTLYIVDVDAPAGDTTNIAQTHIMSNVGNNQPQGTTYQFDLRLGEGTGGGLTFEGSLYLTTGFVCCTSVVDLSPESFLATSTTLSGANPPLYALYTTFQPGTVTPGWTTSNGTEFWAGASVTPVPEPGTLLLAGSGMVGLGVWWRRSRRIAA